MSQVLFEEGRRLASAGNFYEAEGAYTCILKQRPIGVADKCAALVNRGTMRMMSTTSGDAKNCTNLAALADYNQVLSYFNDCIDALVHRAMLYCRTNRHRLAFLDCNRVISSLLLPNPPPITHTAFVATYITRGILHRKLLRHDLAARDFNRAIAIINPTAPSASAPAHSASASSGALPLAPTVARCVEAAYRATLMSATLTSEQIGHCYMQLGNLLSSGEPQAALDAYAKVISTPGLLQSTVNQAHCRAACILVRNSQDINQYAHILQNTLQKHIKLPFLV